MAKQKGSEKKLKDETPESDSENLEENEDEETGFGGLPDRDLKKNLGCG